MTTLDFPYIIKHLLNAISFHLGFQIQLWLWHTPPIFLNWSLGMHKISGVVLYVYIYIYRRGYIMDIYIYIYINVQKQETMKQYIIWCRFGFYPAIIYGIFLFQLHPYYRNPKKRIWPNHHISRAQFQGSKLLNHGHPSKPVLEDGHSVNRTSEKPEWLD